MDAWALPLLITLYTFDENTSPWVYFAVITLLTSAPYVHPIQVAWASRNSYSVKTRFVPDNAYASRAHQCIQDRLRKVTYINDILASTHNHASLYNMFVQAGGITQANIYRDDDKVMPFPSS